MSEPANRTSKARLRQHLLGARHARDASQREEAAHRVSGGGASIAEAAGTGLAKQVISIVQRTGGSTVAAYVSMGLEPPTELILERLHSLGITVLLPLLLDDHELDWARYVPGELRTVRLGLSEASSPGLGSSAIRSADVICCPGLAGSPQGHRLGRGGGSYDRALSRALPDSLRCLLLYDEEVLADIPIEPHDQRVDVLITPTRTITTSPGRR